MDACADLNSAADDGFTAMMLADQCGHGEILRLLLDVDRKSLVSPSEEAPRRLRVLEPRALHENRFRVEGLGFRFRVDPG